MTDPARFVTLNISRFNQSQCIVDSPLKTSRERAWNRRLSGRHCCWARMLILGGSGRKSRDKWRLEVIRMVSLVMHPWMVRRKALETASLISIGLPNSDRKTA